jgi:predicted kinase
LEFDDRLATTDVLYDLAFLLMDLWEKGYHVQASQLFNRYLDMREESDGVAALPLFLSLRAAIRSHVSASAASRQKTEEERLAKLETARGYLAAAQSFLERSEPRLIAIGGLSGTGKSTLASWLAPKLGGAPGARWLRTDVLRKRLAGVKPEVSLPRQAYSQENNAAVYRRLLDEATRMLAAGRSVIVDGVFADPAEREKIAEVAIAACVRFTGLWLEASRETLIDRIMSRVGDASDADRSVVEHQLNYELGDLSEWIHIDANGAPDDVMARALRQMK